MDTNTEMKEYQAIKRWLAGEHPPAQGRSWRRQAVAAVLHAVQTVEHTTREHPVMVVGTILGGVGLLVFPGLFLLSSMPFLDWIHGSSLPDEVPPTAMLRTMSQIMKPFLQIFGCLTILMTAITLFCRR
jgi:hypothetical protein